ncbi:MAG: lasso RiPP family leader peptide-containing protein [Acidimicrobiales bacterium]
MKHDYEKPELRSLGTFSELTLGMNGSCPDGFGNTSSSASQLGGMSLCGRSAGMGP